LTEFAKRVILPFFQKQFPGEKFALPTFLGSGSRVLMKTKGIIFGNYATRNIFAKLGAGELRAAAKVTRATGGPAFVLDDIPQGLTWTLPQVSTRYRSEISPSAHMLPSIFWLLQMIDKKLSFDQGWIWIDINPRTLHDTNDGKVRRRQK
jgi:hypothetical protein